MKTVNVGIIGTSWWADAMYLPALKNHPRARIEAVAGRNPETTRKFASRWEIPRHYEDADELIEKAQIDALIIATGNESHCPLTLKAIGRGLHVLCEKPLGLSYPEAHRMAVAANESGMTNMVPFTYSFMPTARFLKELIDLRCDFSKFSSAGLPPPPSPPNTYPLAWEGSGEIPPHPFGSRI